MKLRQALTIAAWSTTAWASMRHSVVERVASNDDPPLISKRKDASESAPFFSTGINEGYTFGVNIAQTSTGYETKYQVNWPGNSSLNASVASIFDAGNARTNSMCITAISGEFPKSVVDRYDAGHPGACTGPFGEACTTALQNTYGSAALSGRPNNGSRGCPTGEFGIDTIPSECQHVFDNTLNMIILSLETSNFNSTNKPATFGSILHDEPNAYKEQTHALHVGLFAAVHYDNGYQSEAAAVCLVVDPEKDSDGSRTSGDETTTTQDGAAVATKMPGVPAMFIAGLGMIAGVL